MKKINKILTLSLASLALFACDDILAKPGVVVNEDTLLKIDGKTDYYKNYFETIYDNLIDSGTANSTIIREIINEVAKKEVSAFYEISVEQFNKVLDNSLLTLANKSAETLTGNEKALHDIIVDKVKDQMIEKVKAGTYSKDNLYNEEKLVNELKTSLYDIKGDTFVTDYLITPDSEYSDLFKADYSDYIERSMFPDILKELMTSVYLYENEYLSLGRAYGREVKYIKLETISTHKDSVPVLINSYIKAFVEGSETMPTASFDLDSLARIYKGVASEDTSQKELDFATTYGITTREDVLEEELEKVGTKNANGGYDILTDTTKRDNDLVSSYTGNYTYPVAHGKELKDRELAALDIVVDDGLVVKSGGLNSLPSAIRDRLFVSNIASNLETITSKTTNESVQVLVPKITLDISITDEDYYLNKFANYDSSTNAYYIVLVDSYYNTSSLRQNDDDSTEVKQTKKDNALKIARLLSTTSSNQTDAITHYLDKYDLEFGDQNFYDYMKETYPDLFEE